MCTTTVTIVDDDRAITVLEDWALKPSGMPTGGRFRLMFFTSTTRNAASGSIGSTTILGDNTRVGGQ